MNKGIPKHHGTCSSSFSCKMLQKQTMVYKKKLFIIKLDVSNKEYFPTVSRRKAGVSRGGFHN